MAHLADLIRSKLLYQYGGIWCDATMYMTDFFDENIYEYSVDEFREAVNNHEYEGDGYLFLFCNKVRNNNI